MPASALHQAPRLLLLLALAAGGPTGCGPTASSGAGASADGSGRSYTVRGVVVGLPEPGAPGRPEILIRHQAIPDFVDSEGHDTGMPGMTMPFPLGSAVSLLGIEPGALIEFTLRVDWQGSPPMEVTALRPLAATERGASGR
jgi:hypothetical protein